MLAVWILLMTISIYLTYNLTEDIGIISKIYYNLDYLVKNNDSNNSTIQLLLVNVLFRYPIFSLFIINITY